MKNTVGEKLSVIKQQTKVEWRMAPLCLALGSFPETLSVNHVEYFALGKIQGSQPVYLWRRYTEKNLCNDHFPSTTAIWRSQDLINLF